MFLLPAEGDVSAFPHGMVLDCPMSTAIFTSFPKDIVMASFVATGPMVILDITAAAFLRAAARRTAIVAIPSAAVRVKTEGAAVPRRDPWVTMEGHGIGHM